jgi:hypothetical protein
LGILSSSNLHYTTIDINPSTNYTTTKIDTGSGNIAYPTGLILNNGEFLAAYRKGNNIYYKKRAFCKTCLDKCIGCSQFTGNCLSCTG